MGEVEARESPAAIEGTSKKKIVRKEGMRLISARRFTIFRLSPVAEIPEVEKYSQEGNGKKKE